MTAPSTFVLTGTFTEPGGAVSAGTVTITPTDIRFYNNGNIIERVPVVVTLDGSGTIGSQTLVQATNGYDLTIALTATATATHNVQTKHIAGTANLSITPSHTTMTLTGTWYVPGAATLATGTIEATDVDTGDLYVATLSSGAISLVLFQNTGGYNIVEKIVGRSSNPSYNVLGTGSKVLNTV